MPRPQKCQHRKVDGSRCGSPAMKGKRMCYFHHASRIQHPNRIAPAPVLPDFPIIEDARSVHIALNQVIRGLLHGTLDTRLAGQILCGLQTASPRLLAQPMSTSRPPTQPDARL